MIENQIIKTYSFLDESGVLVPKDGQSKNYYGIGILKHTRPNQIIQKLHPIHESLCSALKKDNTRVEFSFKSTTTSSIKFDLMFLDALLKDFNWEFNCLYFSTSDKQYQRPENQLFWDTYIQYTKMLIKQNLWRNEETILIADYQRKPTISRKHFEYISLDIPQVYNVLQVDSHGVLLVQAADMLLGGFLYSLQPELGDKLGHKTSISQKVVEIKDRIGNKKFNCWAVDWSKSCSRVGRV